jgi:hypothetical protein
MSIETHIAVIGIALATLAGQVAWASETPEVPQEVTVTANRLELEKKISKFVYQIAALQNGEGMARWRVPVCPIVAGVSQAAGEFAVKRIAEIARAAAVPVAGHPCRPNLLVFVTPDAKQLFSGMSEHTRLVTFAGAHTSVIDEFIRTPRPVRAWYRTDMWTPDGKSLGDTDRFDADAFPPVQPQTSYTRISVVWGIRRVLLVLDQARLQGVSVGQFADYVAMAGLAQVKLGAPLGDAPTILKLFDGTPQAAPDGMSDWDRAFLKSLYATESTSKGQRTQIAQTIVHEMTH